MKDDNYCVEIMYTLQNITALYTLLFTVLEKYDPNI